MALARAHGAHAQRASALTEAGFVRLNGKRVTAPSQPVRAGDVVTLALDRAVKVIQVEGFCERRGAAPARSRALPRFDNGFRRQGLPLGGVFG